MAVRLTEATKHDAQGMFIPAECAVRSKVEILAPEHIAAADTFHAIWRAVSKQTATGWAGCQSHGHLDFAPPVLIAVGEDGSSKLALCYRAGRDSRARKSACQEALIRWSTTSRQWRHWG